MASARGSIVWISHRSCFRQTRRTLKDVASSLPPSATGDNQLWRLFWRVLGVLAGSLGCFEWSSRERILVWFKCLFGFRICSRRQTKLQGVPPRSTWRNIDRLNRESKSRIFSKGFPRIKTFILHRFHNICKICFLEKNINVDFF